MPRLQADALLFDLDGTLVDVRLSYLEAVRLTAERALGEPVSPDEVGAVKRVPGFNNDWDAAWGVVGWRRRGQIAPPDATERTSLAYLTLQSIFQTLYLGDRVWESISGQPAPFAWPEPLILRETPMFNPVAMERLSALPLGIATSRPRAEALMALTQHGLDRYLGPERVVAMEDAPREKPDPAPLFALAARLRCTAPIYVGDTVNDALAAQAAGMPFVQVGRDPLTAGEPAARLDSVDELEEVLEALPVGGTP